MISSQEVREHFTHFAAGQRADLVAGGGDVGGVVGQLGELVDVVGSVGLDAVVEGADGAAEAEIHLETVVAHRAHVAGRGGVARVGRDLHLHQHAGGVLDVVVEGGGDPVAQQAQVHAEVGLDGLLPLGVRVREAGGPGCPYR